MPANADLLELQCRPVASTLRRIVAIESFQSTCDSQTDPVATIEEALNQALIFHQAGDLIQAESIYRQILEVQPTNAMALNLLGALHLQQKKTAEAVIFLEQAVEQSPTNPDILNNLGGALQAEGRWQDSIDVLLKAIELAPDNAKFRFDLGNGYKSLSRFDDAIVCFQAAIKLQPSFVQAINNLGLTYSAVGQTADAIQSFRSALSLKPDYANAQNGLGNALLASGLVDEATEWLRNAVTLRPSEAMYHCNLGVAWKASGRPEEAWQSYQQALKLAPGMLAARKNLGNLYVSQQRNEDAIREFEAFIDRNPEDVEILIAIGNSYRDLEDFPNAIESFSKAVKLRPDDDWLTLKTEFLCPAVFNSTQDMEAYRKGLLVRLQNIVPSPLDSDHVESRGLMPPFGLTYHGLDDLAIKSAVANLYRDSFTSFGIEAQNTSSSRPKIGFFVTNGHEKIFLRCMGGIVDRLDRDRFEVWVVAPAAAARHIIAGLRNDAVQVIELADRFHSMLNSVREASLDLLYFWEVGTDLHNYFLPLARAARMQCTGWGMPVTTGLPTMDFFLSSAVVEPPGAVDHYCEELILSHSLLTWQEPIEIPEALPLRADLGFSAEDHIFVCAQNLLKIHPEMDQLFAGILRTDGDARIILVEDRNNRLAPKLAERFQGSYPDVVDRIEFRPRMSLTDYMGLLSIADAALDPLHYGGGITPFELFAVGIPVVTLPTKFRRGRFVAACYRLMGIEACIATNFDEYVRIACELAADKDGRESVKGSIRDKRSVLFEDTTAVTAFEDALEQMLSRQT